MEILEMFDDVTYNMPTLTEAPPATTDFNDIHRFTGSILVNEVSANGKLKATKKLIELWEICPGILVSPDRLDCGIARKDSPESLGEEIPDGWQSDNKYFHKARLTTDFLGESLELQRENYLKAVIKIFKYYKKNLKKSENVRRLMKRIQLEPICGDRGPNDPYFMEINTPSNSIDIYSNDGVDTHYVGKKWVNLIIIPPTSISPINHCMATPAIIPERVGLGYYGIIHYDPFMCERIPNDPLQESFVNNPALRLVHEMIHVLHYHRGVSHLSNKNRNPPDWCSIDHRITGVNTDETPVIYEKKTPMEEVMTFNRMLIHPNLNISKARYKIYIHNIIYSKATFSDPNAIDGVKETVTDFLDQYTYEDHVSEDLKKLVKNVFGIKFSNRNNSFIIEDNKIKDYVKGAFIVDEVKIATKLNIITRPYYNVNFKGKDSGANFAYRVDILNDDVFSIENGLKSQKPEDHSELSLLNQPAHISTINVALEGKSRVSMPSSSSSYLQDDVDSVAIGGVEIDEHSSIDKSEMQVSYSIDDSMYEVATFDDALHLGNRGGLAYPETTKGPLPSTDVYSGSSISVRMTKPTAPMINEVMTNNYTQVPEERPLLNQDLTATLKTDSEIYVPKIKPMTTLKGGVDVATGGAGFALWVNNIITDISDAIRTKQVNYGKFGNDIMSFIPFYCAFTNLSEKDYEMALVNAELDAFSIFVNSGNEFSGLSTFIASITVNVLIPKQATSWAYQDAFDRYLEQYTIDMNKFVYESFLQWQENIVSRLANESRIAIQGFSNMLNTTEATMLYDAERKDYSEADRAENKKTMETTHSKFDKLLQEFAKNCMISNTKNAFQIFSYVMFEKILSEFVKYNKNSYAEFNKVLNEAFSNGYIGTPTRDKYRALCKSVFWNMSDIEASLKEARRFMDSTIQNIKSSSLKWNLSTDFTGNALHIDTVGVINSAPEDICDLYGNYIVGADKETVSVIPARFDRVLKINKSTTPNTVALTISSKDDKKYKLIKGMTYTISFWIRMPVPHSSEERKLFSYSAYADDKELEELVLEVKKNNFVLRTDNQLSNNERVIEKRIALNRWVKITLDHGNNRIRVFVDTACIGEINTSSRKNPISPRGVLKFYNFNVDYQIDEVSQYNRRLTSDEVRELFKDKEEYARDYWGERLEYDKKYYLLSNNNKAAFVKNKDKNRLEQASVPAVYTKYLGLDEKFYGYYGGMQFYIRRVSGQKKDKFVRMNDKFTLDSEKYVGELAIIEQGYWMTLRKYLVIVQPSDGYDAEVFRFDSQMFSKNSEILIGTGENAWKESLEPARGTSDELWLNPQHMSGFTTTVDKDRYSDGEIRNNFEWIFVPRDPNWTEE